MHHTYDMSSLDARIDGIIDDCGVAGYTTLEVGPGKPYPTIQAGDGVHAADGGACRAPVRGHPEAQRSSEQPPHALLHYFGGKWRLAPWVISHLPPHRVYVEPFGGAASILLRKPRSKIEVYNDLDEEIVGIFRVVQDPAMCQELLRLLRRTPYARREFEQAFLPSDDPIIRAQRAIIRSHQSFHKESLFDMRKATFADALHRRRSQSSAARRWATYPRGLIAIMRRLQGVIIECRPASDVIRAQDCPDTLFFVDPPYMPTTRSKSGYRHELDEAGHLALLEQLKDVKGLVVLAGHPSEIYDSALKGWKRVEREFYTGTSTRRRTEVLWISPRAAKAAGMA